MKKIYFFLFILFVSSINAQIVNFTDANFKAHLLSANTTNNIAKGQNNNSIKIDSNNNGEIEISEALAVYSLQIWSVNINDVTGISSFGNLVNLLITGNNITSLNLTSQTNIATLYIENAFQLTSLTLNNNANLYNIFISETALTSLNFSNMSNLDELNIYNTPLNSLNINGCSNIEELVISNTLLTSFHISNLQNFSAEIYVQNNPIMNSFLITDSSIEKLFLNSNALNSLTVQNMTDIYNLYCHDNNLTGITIVNCPTLEVINCNNNNITSLNLSNLSNLRALDIQNNSISNLDLSLNPNLDYIQCSGNNMDFLNLKNGKTHSSTGIGFNNNPNLIICSDDSEFTMFQNAINSNPTLFQNYIVTSYCSFTPGGTFYTIQGNTKYDFDTNGCSPTDTNKPHQKFNISGGGQSGSLISNSTGNYMIPVQAGNHTITPILENPTYWTISPSSFTANFPTQTSPLTQNFCISSNGTHNDLEVVIVPINAAAPGFTSKYKVIYKNKGTHTQSGNLSLSYNDNLMDFNSATTSPVTQSSGLLNWNFSNLLPFETREITVTYTLNTPTATPPLNGGDILNFNSLIIGATDETPSDNNFALNQTVVNSFDPNDKTCLEGSSIATTKVGDYVHYLVRFENTGTANAQNIVVKDLIDTTKFDLSSLVALNGSHSFITRITNPNTVEFIFENIQLPFANATNDGYVLFKIKTKSTLVLGDSFSNTANIYFDYNAPIVTNTYSTSVQNSLATDETEISNEFSIFPNPVSDFVSFKSPERIQKIEIFDLSGRIICANAVQNNSSDLSILSKGNYIIKAYSKQKTYIKKLIKK